MCENKPGREVASDSAKSVEEISKPANVPAIINFQKLAFNYFDHDSKNVSCSKFDH